MNIGEIYEWELIRVDNDEGIIDDIKFLILKGVIFIDVVVLLVLEMTVLTDGVVVLVSRDVGGGHGGHRHHPEAVRHLDHRLAWVVVHGVVVVCRAIVVHVVRIYKFHSETYN